jgi:hypothetical protein
MTMAPGPFDRRSSPPRLRRSQGSRGSDGETRIRKGPRNASPDDLNAPNLPDAEERARPMRFSRPAPSGRRPRLPGQRSEASAAHVRGVAAPFALSTRRTNRYAPAQASEERVDATYADGRLSAVVDRDILQRLALAVTLSMRAHRQTYFVARTCAEPRGPLLRHLCTVAAYSPRVTGKPYRTKPVPAAEEECLFARMPSFFRHL